MASSSFDGYVAPKKDGGKGTPSFYAEGTFNVISPLLTFTRAYGSTYDLRYVEVSGLNFGTGIKVILIGNANYNLDWTTTSYDNRNSFGYFNLRVNGSGQNDSFILDGVNAYVNKNGFRLPVWLNVNTSWAVGQPLTWKAWG